MSNAPKWSDTLLGSCVLKVRKKKISVDPPSSITRNVFVQSIIKFLPKDTLKAFGNFESQKSVWSIVFLICKSMYHKILFNSLIASSEINWCISKFCNFLFLKEYFLILEIDWRYNFLSNIKKNGDTIYTQCGITI